LLCAALGWREAQRQTPTNRTNQTPTDAPGAEKTPSPSRAAAEVEVGAGEMRGSRDSNASSSRGPVIVYASRTHSQLAQVIKELKTTRYRPRMAVIGSRTQMCVHKEVRRLTGVAQQTACRQKTESRTCAHYNEVDRFLRSDPEFGEREPVDIEDLVRLGEKGRVGGGCGPCPYYASQDMASRADIVFAPYNYLIDPKLRETFGNRIRWNDAILLFDEAHNVEGACAEAASFELPAANLASAVREAQEAFELAAAEEELSAASAEPARLLFNARGRGEDDGFGGAGERLGVNGMKRLHDGDRDGPPKRRALEYKQLRGILLALESKIASELDGVPGAANGAAKELVKPCAYFFDVLASLRITDEPTIAVDGGGAGGGAGGAAAKTSSLRLLTGVMRDAALTLAGEAAAASGGGAFKSRASSSFRLTEVADALEKAFAVRESGQMDAFRVRIGAPDAGAGRGGAFPGGSAKPGPTLSFWCFTPGVAMRALKEKGARCVVLTSGTLSPMSSFASELAIPFPVRLENPHVIAPDQVWGGVVPVGPSGKRLNSSYRFRDTDEYKAELGNAIVNFARVVPDGLLVFFPSYGVMRACVEFWRGHGTPSVWDRVCAAKHAVVEPQDKKEFAAAFAEFNAALGLELPKSANANANRLGNGAGPLDGGSGVARHRGGAAFFAVCRGKVSEGIDFPDRAGRAVILTGIPYAPKADAKVRLKRGFLDEKKANAERGSDVSVDRDRGVDAGQLTGEAWYSQTAMRAVNQALGRVIRHRNDHGAVVLLDERFGYGNARNQLSVWLRPAIQSFDAFGPAAAQLSRFFKRCAARGDETMKPSAGETSARDPSAKDARETDEEADEEKARRRKEKAPSLFGGAFPVRRFRVDPETAPPAYPRATVGPNPVGLFAALEGDDARDKRKGGAPSSPRTKKKTGSLSAMLARAAMPAPLRAVADPVPAASSPKTGNAKTAEVRDPAVAPTDPARLFMRRARHELGAAAHETLVRALRDFKANGDAAAVLRVATRALRAEDDPSANGLYATFGVLVPETHKRAHAAHLDALRARKKALPKKEKEKGDARDENENENASGAGPATTALDRDPSRVSRKRARSSPSSSLSRDLPASSLSRDAREAIRAAIEPPTAVAVARPPPRCVLCGNACRKPFEAKCGHPACYACWLAHIAGRTGTGPGGRGSPCACPSCHQPVIKRQLTKVFFT